MGQPDCRGQPDCVGHWLVGLVLRQVLGTGVLWVRFFLKTGNRGLGLGVGLELAEAKRGLLLLVGVWFTRDLL